MKIDLSAISSTKEDIDRLTANGWQLEDHPDRISAAVEGRSSPTDAVGDLDGLAGAILSVRASGRLGPLTVGMRLIGDSFEIDSVSPNGNVERFFDEPLQRDLARQLEDRESEAALALPLAWDVVADLDLGRLLVIPPGIELRVVMSESWLANLVASADLTSLVGLMPSSGARRLYVALDGVPSVRHFGAISFAGPVEALDLPRATRPLAGEVHGEGLAAATPPPSSLIALQPASLDGAWETVARALAAGFVASTWQRLASQIHQSEAVVEFLGFKRLRAPLPTASQMTDKIVEGTEHLYRWAFQDLSSDRLLAVRQVVSLYEDMEALLRPRDVLDSAEVVFLGLRTEAVAEVIKGTREAQAQAVDTVRTSLKAVQDLAKSATERVLASLVGVGAVVATNATKTLNDEVGRNLLLVVAAFLVLLAIFAVAIEGPLLSLPLSKLSEDLRSGNPMLTDAQRTRALSLPSIGATRTRVRVLRIAVPTVYAGLAAAITLWGFPERYS